ncbi:chorismate synthase [Candidatus Vidania fulgoroideorum]
MNSIGDYFKVSTFGESHGKCIGCLIEGCPSGLFVNKNLIQKELNLRKPGRNKLVTSRYEEDKIKILSGIFNNKTTGTPIVFIVKNNNKRSIDYKNISNLFRPGHADYTYFKKYKNRDYRGGGRSSARTTVGIVLAGAFCKNILNSLYNINFFGYLKSVGNLNFYKKEIDDGKNFISKLEVYKLKKHIKKTKEDNNSTGGVVCISINNIPVGLGEPLFSKVESEFSKNVIGINAVKALEIGIGFDFSFSKGSKTNDGICNKGFLSNNSGGILGGISTGQDISLTIHIKPTSSILKGQKTVNLNLDEKIINIVGRHDPCVALRVLPIVESIISITLLDLILKSKFSFFF